MNKTWAKHPSGSRSSGAPLEEGGPNVSQQTACCRESCDWQLRACDHGTVACEWHMPPAHTTWSLHAKDKGDALTRLFTLKKPCYTSKQGSLWKIKAEAEIDIDKKRNCCEIILFIKSPHYSSYVPVLILKDLKIWYMNKRKLFEMQQVIKLFIRGLEVGLVTYWSPYSWPPSMTNYQTLNNVQILYTYLYFTK